MSNLAPVRNKCVQFLAGYFPKSQSNHYNIVKASVCTDQYCTRPSAMLGLGQCRAMQSDGARISCVVSLSQFRSPLNVMQSLALPIGLTFCLKW